MFRLVYVESSDANAQGTRTSVQGVAPTAQIVITPDYAGYSGPVYVECTVDDAHQDDLTNTTFGGVADSGSIPDGSGSLILRNVRSTICDRIAGVQAMPEATTQNKFDKLAALNDLIGDSRDDMETRPIDFAAQAS